MTDLLRKGGERASSLSTPTLRVALSRQRWPKATIVPGVFEAVSMQGKIQLLLCNAPYFFQNGKRAPYRIDADAGEWLQPGGIHVSIFTARSDWDGRMINHWLTWYDQVRVWKVGVGAEQGSRVSLAPGIFPHVKGDGGGEAPAADEAGPSVERVGRVDGLSHVLDDPHAELVGDLQEGGHIAGLAVELDREHAHDVGPPPRRLCSPVEEMVVRASFSGQPEPVSEKPQTLRQLRSEEIRFLHEGGHAYL